LHSFSHVFSSEVASTKSPVIEAFPESSTGQVLGAGIEVVVSASGGYSRCSPSLALAQPCRAASGKFGDFRRSGACRYIWLLTRCHSRWRADLIDTRFLYVPPYIANSLEEYTESVQTYLSLRHEAAKDVKEKMNEIYRREHNAKFELKNIGDTMLASVILGVNPARGGISLRREIGYQSGPLRSVAFRACSSRTERTEYPQYEQHGHHGAKEGDVSLLPAQFGPQPFGLYPRLGSGRPARRNR
jgi:hypothetical protein